MSKDIMIGCDLHERWMLLKVAVGTKNTKKHKDTDFHGEVYTKEEDLCPMGKRRHE
jgi:hypothetical protein